MTTKPNDLIGFSDFKIPFLKIPKLKSLRDPFNEPIYYRMLEGATDSVIVLVHGMGGDSRYLTQMALQLSQQTQHTIVLPDLKFHGEMNQDKSVRLLPHQDIVTELQFLLDHYKRIHPTQNVFLVGHSMGGSVVLKWLLSQPVGAFQKVGLISPYLPEPYIVESSRFNFWIKRTEDKFRLRFPEQALWGSEVEEYDSTYIRSCVPEALNIQKCSASCADIRMIVSDADLILDVNKYQTYFASEPKIKFQVLAGFSHLGVVTSPQSSQQISTFLFP